MDARTGLPIVGMVGAGQLARMAHQAAIRLGQSLRILADSSDDAAALVASDVVVGDYRCLDDLRAFAAGCDVLTWDHEHVPTEHIETLAAEGVSVQPGAHALRYAQDKALLRHKLTELGIPATTLLSEVPIAREVTALVARSPYGQGASWPVVETVRNDGIVISPAPGLAEGLAQAAEQVALRLAAELGVTGVLAVELVETTDGRLLVDDLAMRPHNSGHWTIEGSRTSQFEQHLRAVLDYPLGATTPTAPVVVTANVPGGSDDAEPKSIDERVHHCMARWPDVKIHLYGTSAGAGHVTALGDDLDDVRERARSAARFLTHGGRL